MVADLTHETIRDFGDQWLAYRTSPGYYGSIDLLADILGPLLPVDSIKGARVADIGSGTGRIVNMLLDAGAAHVTALEPSDAIEVLKANTAERSERIDYIKAPGQQLPSDLCLDLVVSIGVVHHIPEPAPVIEAAYRALRPGGHLVVWLYGQEGNETYLRFAEPLRRVTTRLPHSALNLLSWAMTHALNLYIAVCRFVPLPMHQYMRHVLKEFTFSVRKLTIYDQLNPSFARYYTRSEAVSLLRDAGFQHVQAHHRHGYSWTVMAEKPVSMLGLSV